MLNCCCCYYYGYPNALIMLNDKFTQRHSKAIVVVVMDFRIMVKDVRTTIIIRIIGFIMEFIKVPAIRLVENQSFKSNFKLAEVVANQIKVYQTNLLAMMIILILVGLDLSKLQAHLSLINRSLGFINSINTLLLFGCLLLLLCRFIEIIKRVKISKWIGIVCNLLSKLFKIFPSYCSLS